IVGSIRTTAFRWTQATGITPLDASTPAWANAISADGTIIVGILHPLSGTPSAFQWSSTSTGYVQLGSLPGSTFSQAFGVSNTGVIVGRTNLGAFIWDDQYQMRNLRDVLVAYYGLGSALAGWTLTNASKITPDGKTIVGTGTNPVGQTEAWIAHL